MTNFKEYMNDLELRVLVPWSLILGRTELVPVLNGKLAKTRFGVRVGSRGSREILVARWIAPCVMIVLMQHSPVVLG